MRENLAEVVSADEAAERIFKLYGRMVGIALNSEVAESPDFYRRGIVNNQQAMVSYWQLEKMPTGIVRFEWRNPGENKHRYIQMNPVANFLGLTNNSPRKGFKGIFYYGPSLSGINGGNGFFLDVFPLNDDLKRYFRLACNEHEVLRPELYLSIIPPGIDDALQKFEVDRTFDDISMCCSEILHAAALLNHHGFKAYMGRKEYSCRIGGRQYSVARDNSEQIRITVPISSVFLQFKPYKHITWEASCLPKNIYQVLREMRSQVSPKRDEKNEKLDRTFEDLATFCSEILETAAFKGNHGFRAFGTRKQYSCEIGGRRYSVTQYANSRKIRITGP